ncbi:MAG: primosomal protein N' [Planctomycetaceae bacterium]|nr:primosomal protein N' [Planctomycetaceae bacterium]
MSESQRSEQPSLFPLDPDPWVADALDDFWVARVVFSEPPFGPYDYLIPDDLRSQVQLGCRLAVPLGRGGRQMMAWCIDITHSRAGTPALSSNGSGPVSAAPPIWDPQRLRPILSIVDTDVLLSRSLLQLASWISEYYVAPLGQVIETIIPAGVRAGAGTRPISYYSLATPQRDTWESLRLSAQQRAVMEYLARFDVPVPGHQILQQAEVGSSPLASLVKRGLLQVEVRRMHTQEFVVAPEEREQSLQLNTQQRLCLTRIMDAIESQSSQPILLHGVTGSGKTEVYLQAIEAVIASGRQAIVLVPEISLTPQTRQRFRRRFQRIAVLHSQLTDPQRHWYWQQIAAGKVDVVIGTRSAIFAPTPHLGLVIIDEEHDGSFKQDKSPRYHARDVAAERCRHAKVPLVLGSATPAIETYQAAKAGRSLYLSLPDRVESRPLPAVSVVDMRIAESIGKSGRSLSRQLRQAMQETLNDGGQIILLLNRRGFSTCIQCPSCGEVVKCRDCDIALTHHRDTDIAVCHFCDYQIPAPNTCPACRYEGIKFSGLGTQKLEAEVRRQFPNATLLRMDTDTMRKPGAHEAALHSFRQGDVSILLGTQMIAKGLDFPNVTLVGVVNADTGLHMPDFRARERVFGLVTQVAGRTGRGPKGGRVIVQTLNPDDPAIAAAAHHNYLAFAQEELQTRAKLGYPPFRRLTRVVVRSGSEKQAEEASMALADAIQNSFATEVEPASFQIIGPAPAPVTKLRGYYRFHFLVIAPSTTNVGQKIHAATKHVVLPSEIQWIVDIDALDMM